MKKNKSRRFVLAALTGLLLFSPVHGRYVPETVRAAQVSSASDSRLAAFDIKPGDLSPAFSPDVYEYTSTVDADVTSVSVQAVPNAAGATIASVEGRDNLQPGTNTIKVTCAAQDNSVSVYTITLTVGGADAGSQEAAGESGTQTDTESSGQPENGADGTQKDGEDAAQPEADNTGSDPDASAKDDAGSGQSGDSKESGSVPSANTLAKLMGTVGTDGAVTLSGATYQLSNNFSYGSITQDIPSAFGEGSVQIGETSYSTLYCESAGIHLVYMENTDGNGSTGFYYYDQKENAVERFKYIGNADNFVVFISAAKQQLPDGYQEKTVKLPKGQRVAAYQNAFSDDMKDYYLIYGIYSDGTEGWYFFDNAQGTYMRYVETAAVSQEPEEQVQQRTVSIEKYNLLYNEYASLRKNGVTIIGALAVAIVVLIIIFTAIVLRGRDDDEETETSENRRVKKKSKKPEETISKSSLAAGRSLDEKESKGKAKKITRKITGGSDDEAPANGQKKQRKGMQEETLRENASRARKLREVKSGRKAEVQDSGSAVQPSMREAGGRTQSYASSEAGSRTQPYSIYGTGGYAPLDAERTGGRSLQGQPEMGKDVRKARDLMSTAQETSYGPDERILQENRYETGTSSRQPGMYGEPGSRAPQNLPQEPGSRLPRDRMYENSSRVPDVSYEAGSRTPRDVQEGVYAAGSRLPREEDLMYEAGVRAPQGRSYGTGSRMPQEGDMLQEPEDRLLQEEDMRYGPGSRTPRDTSYGPDGRTAYQRPMGPEEHMPQEAADGRTSYGAAGRPVRDMSYGSNDRTPQDMSYGPNDHTPQDMPYGTGSSVPDRPQGTGSRGQDMPYGTGSSVPDRPQGTDSREQDVPYGTDSRMQDRPYPSDSRVQNTPYGTGSRVGQEMFYDTDGGQGTASVSDGGTGPQPESYTAGRRLQRAGVPGSRLQQEMYERDSRLQQARENQSAMARTAAEQDPVQLAAENMRRSVQYTRRTPVTAASEEEPAAESAVSVPHDPMDDWEVGEKPAGRKSHKKRRSLIDEDMEIMDLNDL